MEDRKQKFEEFVKNIAGRPVCWGAAVSRSLPQLLKQRYALYEIGVGRQCFLGICLKDNEDFKPAAFEKHLRQINTILSDFDGYCVIADGLPGYVRQRMVERRIPFVDIGRQLFWPELGAAYQQKKLKSNLPKVDTISPSTQALLIHALVKGLRQPVTPKKLAKQLGYTAMTMTRAFDEIEVLHLGTIKREGKERLLLPESSEVLWEHIKPYLKSPVRDIKRIKEEQFPLHMRLTAGETALAQRSMLTPPKEPVYALWSKRWKELAKTVKTLPIEDEGTCKIQIWRYDPNLFARENRVDPFSLYLSLQHEDDERVETALEEMMEKMEWS